MRYVFSSRRCASGLPLLQTALQQDDEQDEQALNDGLPEEADVEDASVVEAVVVFELENLDDHAQEQGADEGAEDRACASRQQGATDHDGGDGDQLPAFAFGG